MFKFEMYMYIYVVFDSDNLKHNTFNINGWMVK